MPTNLVMKSVKPHAERGATLVEVSIVLPLFTLLMISFVTTLWLGYSRVTLSFAVEQGVRVASGGRESFESESEFVSRIRDSIKASASHYGMTITDNTLSVSTSRLGSIGMYATVSATREFSLPIIGSLNLSASSLGRIETQT